MKLYEYVPGKISLLINIPHAGTIVPTAILNRFNEASKQLPDTDWHVPRLYDFARAMGAHMLIATHSRYVVDLNRDPTGASLYPGKFTTSLCPTTLFDETPLYLPNQACTPAEIEARTHEYWQPYHDKLAALINELPKPLILLDAHSIRSEVPALFTGILPDLNIGTADGISADPNLISELMAVCRDSPFTSVCNGRFKGGYITRHYGTPAKNIHAIQLELAQKNYMQEDHPYRFDEEKAAQLQRTLRNLISSLISWISR